MDPPGDAIDHRSERTARWAWGFRVPITLAAVVLFNQAVLAGQFMAGTFGSLSAHRIGSSIAEIIVLLAVVGAGMARFRGRYPRWPIGVTALLLVAISGQEWAGEQRILAVHVPLGVSIIVVAIGLTVWAWRES